MYSAIVIYAYYVRRSKEVRGKRRMERLGGVEIPTRFSQRILPELHVGIPTLGGSRLAAVI